MQKNIGEFLVVLDSLLDCLSFRDLTLALLNPLDSSKDSSADVSIESFSEIYKNKIRKIQVNSMWLKKNIIYIIDLEEILFLLSFDIPTHVAGSVQF